MNCQQAKELIDERVHDGAGPSTAASAAPKRATGLDAHLAGCPKCAASLAELMRTREVLAEASGEAPSEKETETMWQAISADPGTMRVMNQASRRRTIRRFVLYSFSAAAVILMAFLVGQWNYSGGVTQLSRARGGLDLQGGYVLLEPESDGRTARRSTTGSAPGQDDRLKSLRSLGYMRDESESSASVEPELRARLQALGYMASGSDSAEGPVKPAGRMRTSREGDEGRSRGETETDGIEDLPVGGSADGRALADSGWVSYGYEIPYPPELLSRPTVKAKPSKAASSITKAHETRAKIIKTGVLAVEVADYEAAVERVVEIAREYGGEIADASTEEGAGGALLGRVVLRVAPERFEGLFAALKEVGRVESENAKSADVTGQYVDLEARIHAGQITEARLQELVKNKSFVDKIGSLLEVEREMSRVRSQIERMQGELRVMADRVGRSTITMTIREPARKVPSASLSVEVGVLDAASASLSEALDRLGGGMVSGKTSQGDGGALRGEYRVRVSLARFGELLAAIESLGRVGQRQVRDWRIGDGDSAWASGVECGVSLVLHERAVQLPAGVMSVEVESLDAALAELDASIASAGASILSNRVRRQNDGSSVAELTLRVEAGRFAELTNLLGPLGRTTGRNVTGQTGGIVGGAARVPCGLKLTLAERPREVPSGSMVVRVEGFGEAREELSELIAEQKAQVMASSSRQLTDGTWMGSFRLGVRAADMDAVVGRLEKLGRVESRQISGTGLGDLSRADPEAMGVIELSLSEKAAISPGPERAGESLRGRLRDGLAGLYASLGWIVYGLVVLAPWLAIAGVMGWIVLRVQRRRRVPVAPEAAA